MANNGLTALKASISNFGTQLIGSVDAKPNKSDLPNIYNVRAVASSNTDLTASKPNAVIDGVTLNSMDQVLFINQTNKNENGIRVYLNNTFATVPDRFVNQLQYISAEILVDEGTIYGDSKWLCTADKGTINPGKTPLPFVMVYSRRSFNQNSISANGLPLPTLIGGAGNVYKDRLNVTAFTNPDATYGIQSTGVCQVKIADPNQDGAAIPNGQSNIVTLSPFSFSTLVPNSTMCLRGKVSGNILVPYLCTTTALTKDPVPTNQVYSSGGTAGGFFSTPFDILLAVIITTDLATAPLIIPIINNGDSNGKMSIKITGTGSFYLPIDPFMIAGRLTVGNFSQTQSGPPIPLINFAAANWNWSSYVTISPTAGAATSDYANKQSNPILITSENFNGDFTLATLNASFDYASKLSMWSNYQVEHNVTDTTGTKGDEHTHASGSYILTNTAYAAGIPINYTAIANANIVWEWFR